jgi:hypothetical protein
MRDGSGSSRWWRSAPSPPRRRYVTRARPDLASLRWLVYLARRLEGIPLALLLATRPPETGTAGELMDDVIALPEVGLLRPGDLSERAVSRLAAEALAADADPEFLAECHRATGGNPFLLRELLGELERRGITPSRDNAGLASQVSSEGVGRSVRTRPRRLGPESAALARAVALLGDPAEPTLAARLAGLDDAAASQAVHQLADASILEAGPSLSFVHPLVRSSVAAELSAAERAAGHARGSLSRVGGGRTSSEHSDRGTPLQGRSGGGDRNGPGGPLCGRRHAGVENAKRARRRIRSRP